MRHHPTRPPPNRRRTANVTADCGCECLDKRRCSVSCAENSAESERAGTTTRPGPRPQSASHIQTRGNVLVSIVTAPIDTSQGWWRTQFLVVFSPAELCLLPACLRKQPHRSLSSSSHHALHHTPPAVVEPHTILPTHAALLSHLAAQSADRVTVLRIRAVPGSRAI